MAVDKVLMLYPWKTATEFIWKYKKDNNYYKKLTYASIIKLTQKLSPLPWLQTAYPLEQYGHSQKLPLVQPFK